MGLPNPGAHAAAAALAREAAHHLPLGLARRRGTRGRVCRARPLRAARRRDRAERQLPNAGWTHRADHVGALIAATAPAHRDADLREGPAVRDGRGARRSCSRSWRPRGEAGADGLTCSNTVPGRPTHGCRPAAVVSPARPLTARTPRDRGEPSEERPRERCRSTPAAGSSRPRGRAGLPRRRRRDGAGLHGVDLRRTGAWPADSPARGSRWNGARPAARAVLRASGGPVRLCRLSARSRGRAVANARP